jgi:hypothetical protein
MDRVLPVAEAIARARSRVLGWDASNPWPVEPAGVR